jgi:cold shock CspA family protein
MKKISLISLGPALVSALLLTGCDAWVGYRHVPYSPDNRPIPEQREESGEHHVRPLRGTVERVDPREKTIVLETGGREVVVLYDEATTVEASGQAYQPENLEAGDRVEAAVERSPDGLMARGIQLLHDVREGDDRNEEEATGLRGVVRSNDTDDQTLEIEPAGGRRGATVVRYDDETVVEYQGRRYSPDNLERGDAVEIELRDAEGEMLAERIVVVGEGQPVH